MLIWGTRRTVVQLAILVLTCPQGHPAAHTVSKLVTRFTFFFVPLFPIRTRHVVQCTLCGMSGEVPKEHAEGLAASAQQQDQQQGPPQPGQHGPQQPGQQQVS